MAPGGKTITALSLLRLVPIPPGEITSGSVKVEGQDLLKVSEAEMRQIAQWITQVLTRHTETELLDRVRGSVRELCQQFPAPAES